VQKALREEIFKRDGLTHDPILFSDLEVANDARVGALARAELGPRDGGNAARALRTGNDRPFSAGNLAHIAATYRRLGTDRDQRAGSSEWRWGGLACVGFLLVAPFRR
jgi:hypothetical protein